MNLMGAIIKFFDHPFFIIFGGISATVLIIGFLLNFIFWILGITPLLWRLGYGRWFRKIAIVANTETYNNLEKDLLDSGIFRARKIYRITDKSLSDIKDHSLLLVDYQSFTTKNIIKILENKKSNAGMIFYYPQYSPRYRRAIPYKITDMISNSPNTIIVNFRGRLLNDIVMTLITTNYEKK
jgi:hypothetical protein